MRLHVIGIILMLLCSITVASMTAFAQEAPVNDPYAGELALLGFAQGGESIPLDGSTISIGPGETIWVLALENINVAYGPAGSGQVAGADVLEDCCADDLDKPMELASGGELLLPISAPSECCDQIVNLDLFVTSRSGTSHSAHLVLVGPQQSIEFTPSASLNVESLSISTGNAKFPSSTHLALLRPGDNVSIIEGPFGEISYRNVATPGIASIFTYSGSDDAPIGSTLHFILESSRVITAKGSDDGMDILLQKNGTVTSSSVTLNSLEVQSFLNIPSLGESGAGGNTPLQIGLHFVHIYSEGTAIAGINLYLPFYVVDTGDYTLLDYAIQTDNSLNMPLGESLPSDLIVSATTSVLGVTTSTSVENFEVSIASVRLFNAGNQLFDYEVSIFPNFEMGLFQGVLYVLGGIQDSAEITEIVVNNFAIEDFVLSERNSKEIFFPDDVQVITNLNTIDISVVDEIGEELTEGTVKVQKGAESYEYLLFERHILNLASGSYIISHTLDETVVEETFVISSSEVITLSIFTIELIDTILTLVILGEIVLVLLLGVQILRTLRMRVEDDGSMMHID